MTISEIDASAHVFKIDASMLKELNDELKAEVASKVSLIEQMAQEPVNNDNHPTLGLHLPGDNYGDLDEIKAAHETQIGELAM